MLLTQNNSKGFCSFTFLFSWRFLPLLATCFVYFIDRESGTSCTFTFLLGAGQPSAGRFFLWRFHFSATLNGRATLLYWTVQLLIVNRSCSISTNLWLSSRKLCLIFSQWFLQDSTFKIWHCFSAVAPVQWINLEVRLMWQYEVYSYPLIFCYLLHVSASERHTPWEFILN